MELVKLMQIKGVKLLKGDIIIIAIIILLSVGIFLFMLPKSSNSFENNILQIYLNGELLDTVYLDKNTYKTIEIDEIAHNTIEIDGEKVRIIDSTCYDHVCENKGYISKIGEVIVCMPNKLLLKIVGEKNQNEYDGVVG